LIADQNFHCFDGASKVMSVPTGLDSLHSYPHHNGKTMMLRHLAPNLYAL